MIKKIILAGACCIALINGAQAANSTDLKISGKLVNGSCTPALENNGVVDFGHIPLGNLSKTEYNQLGFKNMSVTLSCDTAIPIGWEIYENKVGTKVNLTVKDVDGKGTNCNSDCAVYYFGLGDTAGNVHIGAYTVFIKNLVTVDGEDKKIITSDSNQPTKWSKWGDSSLVVNGGSSGYRTILAAEQDDTLQPLGGKLFKYDLRVTAAIQGTDTLAITDTTNLDGSATISLVYI